MQRNLDLNLLRTYVTIVEQAGFTKAADRLCITQSAASLQMKRLQEQFGQPLFERSGRTVQLTEDGRILLAYAHRLLEVNDDAMTHMMAKKIAGVVKLGVVEEFIVRDLPKALDQFNRVHTHVQLEVQVDLTRHLVPKLHNDELHLVIGLWARDFDVPAPELGTPLKRERLLWICRNDFEMDPDAPVPLVVSPAPCIHRKMMLDALDRAQRSWRIVCHTPTAAAASAVVLAGVGIGALSESMIIPGLRVLTTAEGLPTLPDNEFVLLTSDRSLPSEARSLADFLLSRHWSGHSATTRKEELPTLALAKA